MTTATANLTTVLSDAEESIAHGVKEVERTFLFTDVPCGALKFKEEDPAKENPALNKEDMAAGLFQFC